ncbi:MAG TPA: GNAT family N-acetyltransferase [Phycisphaerales bacterium]|nr:GNAT family N-acetyltransferase [Phycisphaerales bacterium]
MNNDTQYKLMTASSHADDVVRMMNHLYDDDPSGSVDRTRFRQTIDLILSNPDHGNIVLFMRADMLCGYALVIPYLSNEWGGTIAFIDELFVEPDFRGQGIGSGFIEYLRKVRPFSAVAIFLEVSRQNMRARKLYDSLGFQERSHQLLTLRIGV